MIGVELDSWSPEGKDGRYDGFRYFSAPEGRGVFIHRRDIMDVIPLQHGLEISSVVADSCKGGVCDAAKIGDLLYHLIVEYVTAKHDDVRCPKKSNKRLQRSVLRPLVNWLIDDKEVCVLGDALCFQILEFETLKL